MCGCEGFHRRKTHSQAGERSRTSCRYEQVNVGQTKGNVPEKEFDRSKQTVRVLHGSFQANLSKNTPIFHETHASPLRTGVDGKGAHGGYYSRQNSTFLVLLTPGYHAMDGRSMQQGLDLRGAGRSWRRWALLALVLAAATLPYLTTLTFGFVYDDRLAIEENPHLRLWPGLGRIFLSDIWSLSGLGKESNYYRPMFLLSYEAVFHAFGAAPWAFHLLNVLFHAAVSGMVFALTLRLWQKESMATMAALLFALHPVHVEPVAWIAALSELAYTLFVLVA